jgi:hypothetical protein
MRIRLPILCYIGAPINFIGLAQILNGAAE